MAINSLSKQARLANRNHIRMLFREGRSFKLHPCRVFYLKKKKEELLCHKVLFSVSKGNVRSAVQRNRIKRLLREAYRIHKYMLDSDSDNAGFKFVFLIGYVYTGNGKEIHYPILNRVVVTSLQYFRTLLDCEKS